MSKFVLDYDQAHAFVEKNKDKGFYWDGYVMVKWTPGHNGFMQKNGMFKNNQWGYSSNYRLTSSGSWEINDKHAKYI